jgi:hypothetical protein
VIEAHGHRPGSSTRLSQAQSGFELVRIWLTDDKYRRLTYAQGVSLEVEALTRELPKSTPASLRDPRADPGTSCLARFAHCSVHEVAARERVTGP